MIGLSGRHVGKASRVWGAYMFIKVMAPATAFQGRRTVLVSEGVDFAVLGVDSRRYLSVCGTRGKTVRIHAHGQLTVLFTILHHIYTSHVPCHSTHPRPLSVKHLLSSLCVLTCPARQHNPLSLNPFSPYGWTTSLLQCVRRVCVCVGAGGFHRT